MYLEPQNKRYPVQEDRVIPHHNIDTLYHRREIPRATEERYPARLPTNTQTRSTRTVPPPINRRIPARRLTLPRRDY